MTIDLEALIKDKEETITRIQIRIANLEGEIDGLKADLHKADSELQSAIMLREQEIAKRNAESAKTNRHSWTISEAASDVLGKFPAKKAHADQILLHLAEYDVAASKAALTSQLAKDRRRFRPLGGNVFQLEESAQEPLLLTEAPSRVNAIENGAPIPSLRPDQKRTAGIVGNVPLGDKAINCLREIGHPLSTSELKAPMVERGLVDNLPNLFAWLHTALKRKEKKSEVFLGADKKWNLPEWQSTNGHQQKDNSEIRGEQLPDQVAAKTANAGQ